MTEIFSIVPCPRLNGTVKSSSTQGEHLEKMVVAKEKITGGTLVLEGTWSGRVNYFASSDDEAATLGEECSFTDLERTTLRGNDTGQILSHEFSQFNGSNGSVLQLACSLIINQHDDCVKWVNEKTFISRPCGYFDDNSDGKSGDVPVGQMDKNMHSTCIEWLKSRKVPLKALLFWAIRSHMSSLCALVTSNSFFISATLSSTLLGMGFCPKLAQFNHDCIPNALVEILTTGYRVCAVTTIAPGEEICISYVNAAVGLCSLTELNETIFKRYGFDCQCPTHKETRPLYKKGVIAPGSLAVIYHKNKSLVKCVKSIKIAMFSKNWDFVQALCDEVLTKFGSIVRSEPRLAFTLSDCYCQSLQYAARTTSRSSLKARVWLDMLEEVTTKYCANPLYVQRVNFWRMLETVRKYSVLTLNTITNKREYCFRACDEEDLHIFLTSWINLRKNMRFSYAGSINAAILDVMLFGGFATYINIMNESVEFVEILIRTKIMDTPKATIDVLGNGRVVEIPVSSVVHPLNGTATLCHKISERVPVKTIADLIASAYEYHDSHEVHEKKCAEIDGPITFEELEPLLQKANQTMFGYSMKVSPNGSKPIGVKKEADEKEIDMSAKSGKKKKRRNKKTAVSKNNKDKEDTGDQNKIANLNCPYLCAFKAAEVSFEKGSWENGTYYPFQEQNFTFCSV